MIKLILGPMFSGKTTELINSIQSQENVLAIKYKYDNRYSEKQIATHDGILLNATTITVENSKEISKKLENLHEFKYIVVDEGQFIENLAPWVDEMAQNGKMIFIAALSGDYNRHLFPEVKKLIPIADFIVFRTGLCKCGAPGSFSKNTIPLNTIENIGGDELYEIVCRNCYKK